MSNQQHPHVDEFKQMAEWTRRLSDIMQEMGVSLQHNITSNQALETTVKRSVNDIKLFLVSHYCPEDSLPKRLNWLLDVVLNRVIHALIADSIKMLSLPEPEPMVEEYYQTHPYEIASESVEEILDTSSGGSVDGRESELAVPGVVLNLQIQLTHSTVGKRGKLKAGAYTGTIQAMSLAEVHDVARNADETNEVWDALESTTFVRGSTPDRHMNIPGVGAIRAHRDTLARFLQELDGGLSVEEVREQLDRWEP